MVAPLIPTLGDLTRRNAAKSALSPNDQPTWKLGRIIWLSPDRFDVKPDKSTWLEMGNCLRDLGWQVKILTARTRSSTELGDRYRGLVEWVRPIDLPFLFRVTVLLSMGRWLARNGRSDDIILINEDALWLLPTLRRLGFEFVHLDIRTLPVNLHRLKRRLDWLLFWKIAIHRFGQKVDSYSFITERLRSEVEAEFNLRAKDYAIWHSGVSLEQFCEEEPNTRRTGGIFRLFYHGSVARSRGIGLVIDAIALGRVPENFEFVIVGEGKDKSALQQQAKRLGIERLVHFKGFIPYDKVVHEIAGADICICPLPDRLEWNVSSPLKVFEYMACAKPIILTPIPAHVDALDGAQFVVWTQGFEPADFSRAIVDAAARRDALAVAAATGPDFVRGRYEWRVQAEILHQHLIRHLDAGARNKPRRHHLDGAGQLAQ